MIKRWAILLLGVCLTTSGAFADEAAVAPEVRFVDALPLYAPAEKVAGTIRLWGHGSPKHDFMGRLMDAWIAGFAKYQPNVKFENHMYGTASAIGALYCGAGDIAILGEEISPAAATAFEREKHYVPTGIQIATGSLDVNYFDYAHMIFVHRDNPLKGLTLAQLDAVFGAEHRRGPRNIRTWGELGLAGEWTDRHIQPYGWQVDVDFALFFREAVLENSHRWNTDLREFVTSSGPTARNTTTVNRSSIRLRATEPASPFPTCATRIRRSGRSPWLATTASRSTNPPGPT